ncbi:hypothetical protein AOLI_G00326130 [Acnodon oligacanthus]
MVLSGTLRAVLLCLLSLCLRGTEAQLVNQNNLARIISHIQTQYSPGEDTQFAVAINIPAQYCTNDFNEEDFENVLGTEKPDDVKNVMNGVKKVYDGKQLIGAKPLPDTKSPINPQTNKHPNFHSEYLLLINSTPLAKHPNPNDPLMKKLLSTDPDGCVIFYTYNSPCTATCLNEGNKDRNILTALDGLRGHRGPKAFVYNKIFDKDKNKPDLKSYFEKIEGNDRIGTFLYRCYRDKTCQLCFKGGEADNKCLDPNVI